MLITLMSAGSDTSTHQIGNAMDMFIAHPAQWAILAAQPGLILQAVEEVIRFSPAVILGVPRAATVDIALDGLELRAGEIVLPITSSANREATVYDGADRFDITCKQRTHLTFGGGIHYCLGAPLGRAELQEALLVLSSRLTRFEHAGSVEWRPPTDAAYGPTVLPMRFRCVPQT
jgi:cytochrome P450